MAAQRDDIYRPPADLPAPLRAMVVAWLVDNHLDPALVAADTPLTVADGSILIVDRLGSPELPRAAINGITVRGRWWVPLRTPMPRPLFEALRPYGEIRVTVVTAVDG